MRKQIDEGTYAELLFELSHPDFLTEVDDTIDTVRCVADGMAEDNAPRAAALMRSWAMLMVVARQKLTADHDKSYEPV